MNQRQMRQLGITDPAQAPKIPTHKTKPVTAPSQNQPTVNQESIINSKPTVNPNPTVKPNSVNQQEQTIIIEPTNPAIQTTAQLTAQLTAQSTAQSTAQPTAQPIDQPIHQTKETINEPDQVFETRKVKTQHAVTEHAVTHKKLPSKEIQHRIDQACMFSKVDPEVLLNDSTQLSLKKADVIRELVLGSITETIKINGATLPILSMLLHCSSEHLTDLLHNLKQNPAKKSHIQIFRQLQSDLQPPFIE